MARAPIILIDRRSVPRLSGGKDELNRTHPRGHLLLRLAKGLTLAAVTELALAAVALGIALALSDGQRLSGSAILVVLCFLNVVAMGTAYATGD